MTSIIGQWAGLHQARVQVAAKQRAQVLIASLTERIASADWSDLGTDVLPWSQARFLDPVASDRDPLTEIAAVDEDSLLAQQLIPTTTGIRQLRVYIEYYRAETSGANQGVLLADSDPASGQPDGFTSNFKLLATRNAARITGGNPTSTVDNDAAIWIRVLAVWSELPQGAFGADANGDGIPDNGQYCQLFLARRS